MSRRENWFIQSYGPEERAGPRRGIRIQAATMTRTQLAAIVLGLVAVGALGYRAWAPSTDRSIPVQNAPISDASAAGWEDAYFEVAVTSPLALEEVEPWTSRDRLVELVERLFPADVGRDSPRTRLHEAAVALVRSERSSTFERMLASQYLLPPQDDAEQIAPQLSPDQRRSFFASQQVIVVRLRGAGGPPHVVARVGFALASALAQRLMGFVDDEVRRRVEDAQILQARAVIAEAPSAFHAESISIEYEPADAGVAGRILTFGMRRFGAPDLELRGLDVERAGAGAHLLSALGKVLAERPFRREMPLRYEDLGLTPKDVECTVYFDPAPLADGNPDNTLYSVRVEGGVDRLLGAIGQASPHAESDDEFAERQRAVKAGLPALLARWRSSGGALQVLADFAAGDGGVEAMWVEVVALSDHELRGTLANEPAFVQGLHLGDEVVVQEPVLSGARHEKAGVVTTLP